MTITHYIPKKIVPLSEKKRHAANFDYFKEEDVLLAVKELNKRINRRTIKVMDRYKSDIVTTAKIEEHGLFLVDLKDVFGVKK